MNEVETIFNLLEKWYKFPKYQLERRLDIFFALYLPEILKKELNIDAKHTNIIPEFPLKKADSNKSNNADYAIFSKKDEKVQLYLIELKTDMRSIKGKQENYYLKAKEDGFREILKDLIVIRDHSKMWEKYDDLLDTLTNYGVMESSIKKENRKAKNGGWSVKSKECENIHIKIIYLIPTDSTEVREGMGEDDSIITFDKVIDIISKNVKPSEVSKCFINILEKLIKSNTGKK